MSSEFIHGQMMGCILAVVTILISAKIGLLQYIANGIVDLIIEIEDRFRS